MPQEQERSHDLLMIDALIELIASIWRADTELRDSSGLGESRLDRDSRRFVARLCGGAITLLLAISGLAWWLIHCFFG